MVVITLTYKDCCPYRLGRNADKSARTSPDPSEEGRIKCSVTVHLVNTAIQRNSHHEYGASVKYNMKSSHSSRKSKRITSR